VVTVDQVDQMVYLTDQVLDHVPLAETMVVEAVVMTLYPTEMVVAVQLELSGVLEDLSHPQTLLINNGD
jgi:hypothetical protein